MVCNWLTHDITVTGTFCKIFVNLAISENGITARGVLEYLDHQYECSSVLSISEKYFTMTYQEPGEQPKSLVVKFQVVNKCPTIMISGYVPATKWFKVGEFKTELIQNNLFDYVIKYTYNGKEVFNFNVALTVGKMDLTLMYDYGVSMKNYLEVHLEYIPTNEVSPLGGGNIKMVAMKESVPFFKFGGYIGLTINTAKYELLFNDFYVNVVDAIEAKLNGKLFIDRINKYGFLKKMTVEAKVIKDKKEVFNFIYTTDETTPKLRIFCPYLLKKVLDLEYLEMKLDHVVTGDEKTITISLNYMDIMVVTKMKPSMIEILIGQVSILKLDYVVTGDEKTVTVSLNYIDTKLVTKMKPSIFECEVLIGQVSHLKLDYVVTGDEKTITVCLNYIDTKLVAKMKPSMIEYEVLIGQVSHLKYVHEFMFENNEISLLIAGKSKLHLHEKSYIYKTLYYLSPSYACFKDMTTNYQVQVVDKATGKVDVRFSVLKDTLEMFQLVAMMKPSMIESEVLIGQVSQLKLDYVVTGDEKTITISLNYIDTKL